MVAVEKQRGVGVKVTKECLLDTSLSHEVLLKSVTKGLDEVVVYWFTYLEEDYERRKFTLQAFNFEQRHLYVTAPEEHIGDACDEIIKRNNYFEK